MKLGEIRRRNHQPAEVDMAPLIDMVFILLIFFMVSSRFVQSLEVDVQRPGAATGETAAPTAVRVVLDAGGAVAVDGVPTNAWAVRTRVAELLAAEPGRPVLVVADRRIDTGTLVEIIDECRRGGAVDVGIDVERR